MALAVLAAVLPARAQERDPTRPPAGAFTVERIGETEVWLRNGKELRKIQRFSGIERHTATERPTP